MEDYQDAYGHNVYDYLQGQGGAEIVERDDGYIDASPGPPLYFSDHKDWPSQEKRAMRYVRGRALDIGCGAGRHALYLQEKGLDVLGVDLSPLAIAVCRERGLNNAKVMPITQISSKLGTFGTLLMLGNNFGLLGSLKRAKWLLKRFRKMTAEKGRIIAASMDPYQTTNPFHLEYHDRNKKKGRMSGQVRIRVRYKKYVTPWFDYLFVSKAEMKHILKGTGWQVRRFIDSEGPAYIAVLE